jgi:myo-inositol-1(or 4)-monophosphatase
VETPLEFAARLAKQAGALLYEQFRSGEWSASLKADRSVVTSADLAADRLIRQAIQTCYPNDDLLSEELQPEFRSDINETNHAIWIVDPLDGTTNFSLGLVYWGVLIARLVHGWPTVAAAFFPAVGELYIAQKDRGAWLNGAPLVICPPDEKRPLSFFACCSRTHRRYQVNVPFKARILGCAAYTFCSVARSIAVLGFEVTPKIWDLAAPWLVVREAGGVIQAHSGDQPFPLRPGIDYSTVHFPTLAAANQEYFERARQQILPKPPPAEAA